MVTNNFLTSEQTKQLSPKYWQVSPKSKHFAFQIFTPPGSIVSSQGNLSVASRSTIGRRRPKIAFTDEEERNLRHGVLKLGRFWREILNTYSFHPCRTPVDLKDKFRNMVSYERGSHEIIFSLYRYVPQTKFAWTEYLCVFPGACGDTKSKESQT